MPIRTLGDLQAAFDAGRFHIQRVFKSAGSSISTQWFDVTFSSGQPPYDAHVGSPLEFTPCVATGNRAIYFPGISPGQMRHLVSVTLRPSQATYLGPVSIVIFDLVGYYPLIDGDSTDVQFFDNTNSLPRYTDGVGVFPILVHHVAPPTANGLATLEYVNEKGETRTITVGVPLTAVNCVASGVRPTAAADVRPLTIALAGADRGVRRVNWIQYSVPPSGLQCLYLARILGSAIGGDNNLAIEKEFYTKNGMWCPLIPDGAWLGWFCSLTTGTATTISWFGEFVFAWG